MAILFVAFVLFLIVMVIIVAVGKASDVIDWFKGLGRRALSMSNWESTKPMRRLLEGESSNTGNGGFTIDLDSILNACKVSSVNLASWLCRQSEEELMHFMGLALCGGALVETVCQVDLPAMEALAHHG